MTPEEKQLLLKDLCARLPYGVICRKIAKTTDDEQYWLWEYPNSIELEKYLRLDDLDINIRPYLRPISSMTDFEEETYKAP